MDTISGRKPDIEHWSKLSFFEQMANLYSEIGRTLKWKSKNNEEMAQKAFFRALDIIDVLIVCHTKKYDTLRELCRLRENFCESFIESDLDNLSVIDKDLSHYAYSLRIHK